MQSTMIALQAEIEKFNLQLRIVGSDKQLSLLQHKIGNVDLRVYNSKDQYISELHKGIGLETYKIIHQAKLFIKGQIDVIVKYKAQLKKEERTRKKDAKRQKEENEANEILIKHGFNPYE